MFKKDSVVTQWLLDTRYFLVLVVGSSSCFQMYPIVLIINVASDVLVVYSELDKRMKYKRMKFTAYVVLD